MYPLLPVLTRSFILCFCALFVHNNHTTLLESLEATSTVGSLCGIAPQVPQQGTCPCLQLCMQSPVSGHDITTLSASYMTQQAA